MLGKTRTELARLDAHNVGFEQDGNFEPQSGTLVRVSIGVRTGMCRPWRYSKC